MSEVKKEFGEAADRAVFKTENPEEVRLRFKEALSAWKKERRTLGGFLRDIRRTRGLLTRECADKVGVSRAVWQAWESGRKMPTEDEIQQICEGMKFGKKICRELLLLRGKAPHHRLLMFSRFRPEFLAARGVAKVEAELEWRKLPGEVRAALAVWGEKQGISSLEELGEFFLSLTDDEARETWVDEVLKNLD